MTAPVISDDAPRERIPMTVPVVSTPHSFSFVLPQGYSASEAPVPLDTRVAIEEVRERTVAVLVFRGSTRNKRTDLKTTELLDVLKKSNFEPIGGPFLMRYNPPFIPGVFRHNEIGVEVKASH